MKSQALQQYIEQFNPAKLANIPSFLTPKADWPKGRSVVAMDMGGTNFRVARVSFDENAVPSISDFKKMTMPGVNSKITSKEFLDFFENIKSEYKADTVGLCFSYPAEILKDGTARIITFSKEVKIDGAENTVLNAKVLNDTTAAQLGTLGANMGMILGTGFNICCTKDGSIINTEAGRYTGFPKEEFDFGELSEMQISGAYLRPLIAKCEELGLATAEEIYDRAAKIAASEIYGIAKFAGIEKIRMAVEGSVYYNVEPLRNKIKENLNLLGCDYEFLDGRDKTLIGAALAALI